MTSNADRVAIHAGRPVRLRDLGYDEIWLQNWLADDPSRLGIGEIELLAQELTSKNGGSLDILAHSGDVYYSIEVQLGEVDASHGFRVFDYWARNRLRYQDKSHIAVLAAESAGGRYSQALAALAEYLPLVVVELQSWAGADEAVIVATPIFVNESLDVGASLVGSLGSGRTEAAWQEELTDEAWQFHSQFVMWTRDNLGEVRVDYTPKSYIGVRRGRRVWAPLWPRKDGANVYLPDPDHVRGDTPSLAFESFRERLAVVSIEPTWSTAYNAGANPISVRLRRPDLEVAPVQEILKASFDALVDGAPAWSESRAATPAVPSVLDGDLNSTPERDTA